MNGVSRHAAYWCFFLLLAGCATTTQLAGAWKDPAYEAKPNQKIVVFALTDSERNMRIWESTFGQTLKGAGAQPIPGSSLMSMSALGDTAAIKEAVRTSGADLVAVTRVVAVDTEQEYVPGTTYYEPGPSYYGFYGYYYSGYSMVHTPGYIQENTIVKLETNIYDVAQEKLVWSGLTETMNPDTVDDAANSISTTIVDDLVQKKVVRKS